MKFIFLVEEKSMQKFLEIFLAERLSANITFRVIPHNGKSELKKSIPSKLKALNGRDVNFIVLMDQDSSDCHALKTEINNLCLSTGAKYKIRIACRELEAWYLGDLPAVDRAFSTKLTKKSNKQKFRNPDNLNNAKQELKKFIGKTGQIETAEKMAAAMVNGDFQKNKSYSFHLFLKTVGLDTETGAK